MHTGYKIIRISSFLCSETEMLRNKNYAQILSHSNLIWSFWFGTMQRNSKFSSPSTSYQWGIPAGMRRTSSGFTSKTSSPMPILARPRSTYCSCSTVLVCAGIPPPGSIMKRLMAKFGPSSGPIST